MEQGKGQSDKGEHLETRAGLGMMEEDSDSEPDIQLFAEQKEQTQEASQSKSKSKTRKWGTSTSRCWTTADYTGGLKEPEDLRLGIQHMKVIKSITKSKGEGKVQGTCSKEGA